MPTLQFLPVDYFKQLQRPYKICALLMDTSISQPLNVSFFNIFVIVCIHKVAANISLQLNINCPAIINKQCTVVVSHVASFHVPMLPNQQK